MSEQKSLEQLYSELVNLIVQEELEIGEKKAHILNFYSVLYPELLSKVGLESLGDKFRENHAALTESLNAHTQLLNSLVAHQTRRHVFENVLSQQRQQAAAAKPESSSPSLEPILE